MPNQGTHLKVAVGAGAIVAWLDSDGRSPRDRLWESLGGAAGALPAGALPDLIDTPRSPNHRGVAHGGLAVLLLSKVDWAAKKVEYRQKADRWRLLAATPGISEAERRTNESSADSCSFWAGAITGFLVGYVSHLALDFTTPRRLPLIW